MASTLPRTRPASPVVPIPGLTAGTPAFRRATVALVCAGLATFAQLYAPQPVLPRIAADLAVTPAHAALTVSAATVGLAIGVLPWSWVAIRLGHVRAMTVSLLAAAACGVAVACAPSLSAVVALRVLQGLALGGVPAVAIAYVQAEIDARHTALVAATFVAGQSVGGLLGRMLATPIAAAYGWRAALLVVTGVAVAMTIAFVALVPATRRPVARPPHGYLAATRDGLLVNLRSPAMLVLFAQAFLLMGVFVAVFNYLAYRLEGAPLLLSPAAVTAVLLTYLVGTASALLAGRWASRVGRLRVLLSTTATMAVGLVLLLSPSLPLTVLGVGLLTGGFFGAHAIASGWVGHRAPAGTAQATALYMLCYYAGSTVTGWAAGLAFVGLGWSATLLCLLALVVLAGALAAGHAFCGRAASP